MKSINKKEENMKKHQDKANLNEGKGKRNTRYRKQNRKTHLSLFYFIFHHSIIFFSSLFRLSFFSSILSALLFCTFSHFPFLRFLTFFQFFLLSCRPLLSCHSIFLPSLLPSFLISFLLFCLSFAPIFYSFICSFLLYFSPCLPLTVRPFLPFSLNYLTLPFLLSSLFIILYSFTSSLHVTLRSLLPSTSLLFFLFTPSFLPFFSHFPLLYFNLFILFSYMSFPHSLTLCSLYPSYLPSLSLSRPSLPSPHPLSLSLPSVLPNAGIPILSLPLSPFLPFLPGMPLLSLPSFLSLVPPFASSSLPPFLPLAGTPSRLTNKHKRAKTLKQWDLILLSEASAV